MIPRIRAATGSAALLALIALVSGCGGKSPASDSAAGPRPTAPSTTTRSAAAPSSSAPSPTSAAPNGGGFPSAAGAVLLLKRNGTLDYGLYALLGGQVSLLYADREMAFPQSAIVSPDGTRIAFIASGTGDLGPLRVISANGTSTDLGPQTLSNAYLPVWSPDGTSVLAMARSSADEQQPATFAWDRINVSTGDVAPVAAPGGYTTIYDFSPDLGYVLMGNSSTFVAARADGSFVTPVVAPSGQVYHRILSLSPDGHDLIAEIQAPGGPGGDAGRFTLANAIVDLRTGTQEAVPGGGDLVSGYYLANGDAILRVKVAGQDKVRLVSPTGATLFEDAVPASATDYDLIGYVAAG